MSILFVSSNVEITEGHGRSHYFGTCGEIGRRASDLSLNIPCGVILSLRRACPERVEEIWRVADMYSHFDGGSREILQD